MKLENPILSEGTNAPERADQRSMATNAFEQLEPSATEVGNGTL
jgi:hypothetical protein